MIFSDNRIHIDRGVDEDSVSEVEVVVKANNKHLSSTQISKICDLFKTGKKSGLEISQDLFVPYSTTWRIIREIKQDRDMINWNKITTNSTCGLKRKYEKLISKYIEDRTVPYTTKDIQNFIKDIDGTMIPQNWIRHYLKSKLHFSYKRISSRPVYQDPLSTEIMKYLYVIEFSNIVDCSKVFVNIDEISFAKSTKINYSWSKKGETWVMNNASLQGSNSFISAITSLGCWWMTKLNSTNDSGKFIEFLGKIFVWLRVDLKLDMNRIILILDNWSIHHSKKSLSYLNNMEWKIIFVSPYSPEFCPIELFFNTLKRRVAVHSKGDFVKLESNSGARLMKEWLATLTWSEIVSYWTKAIGIIRSQFSNLTSKEG